MNPFEMVVLIVAIVMFAGVVRSAITARHARSINAVQPNDGEARQLREEVKTLKDRVAVLERIATDKANLLDQEFERLRDER